jgi:hypothetical protein
MFFLSNLRLILLEDIEKTNRRVRKPGYREL